LASQSPGVHWGNKRSFCSNLYTPRNPQATRCVEIFDMSGDADRGWERYSPHTLTRARHWRIRCLGCWVALLLSAGYTPCSPGHFYQIGVPPEIPNLQPSEIEKEGGSRCPASPLGLGCCIIISDASS
jgi:hypothetical protein